MPDSISDTHFLRRGACNPLYFRQQTQSLIGGKNAITRRGKSVNILRKGSYRVTTLLSMLCKTYCFAFQKRRFCKVKAALLRCKSPFFCLQKVFFCNLNRGFFALQYSHFRNAKAQLPLFKDFIFTKLEGFGGVCLRGF